MRRVLVLSYYFPPLGGVGAQRPLKFVKYLPEWGYVATVVTGPPDARTEWAPADSSLNAEVPTGTEVLRAEGPPPPVAGTRHRLSRWFGLWSPFQQWWRRESLRLGRSAVADVDVVYTMMSPFSTAVAAASVAGAAGKPWIADLQDPWALDEWTVYPTALHRRLDELQMRRDLRSAAAVITTTREAAQVLVARFPEFADSRVRTIPWGWDRSDFKATPQPRGDDAFRIVYAGYSHVQRGHKHRARQSVRTLLGGAVRGMDVLPRSHVFLLEAIERIGRVDPDLAGRVELHVAGPAPTTDGTDTGGVVRHHGYLAHDRAVGLMRSADVLFLAMHDLPAGMRARTVPGKTYEYLASGRPILAALPDGDARDMLSDLPNVWVCRPTDVAGMAKALVEISRSRLVGHGPSELALQFEWRELSRQLAAVFDETLRES